MGTSILDRPGRLVPQILEWLIRGDGADNISKNSNHGLLEASQHTIEPKLTKLTDFNPEHFPTS